MEWSIGEAVGLLVKYASEKNVAPRTVRDIEEFLKDFQKFVRSEEIETEWKGREEMYTIESNVN